VEILCITGPSPLAVRTSQVHGGLLDSGLAHDIAMPIERRLDPDTHILWTTIWGSITIHDLRRHLDAVSAMSGAQYCEIIDVREAEPLFSARDLPGLANHGRKLFAAHKMAPRAVVVDKTDLFSFGISRLFSTLASPWVTFQVFDNLPAAVDYIDAMTAARK